MQSQSLKQDHASWWGLSIATNKSNDFAILVQLLLILQLSKILIRLCTEALWFSLRFFSPFRELNVIFITKGISLFSFNNFYQRCVGNLTEDKKNIYFQKNNLSIL